VRARNRRNDRTDRDDSGVIVHGNRETPVRTGRIKTIALDRKLQAVKRLADGRLVAHEVRLLDPDGRLSELSRS
jgi:hypothetical protein